MQHEHRQDSMSAIKDKPGRMASPGELRIPRRRYVMHKPLRKQGGSQNLAGKLCEPVQVGAKAGK